MEFIKRKKIIYLLFLSLILLGFAQPAKAQLDLSQGLSDFLEIAPLPDTPLPIIIGNIVRVIIGFTGLIAVIIIIIGGLKWMTSGGNPEKISSAKKLMLAGLIGLLIIILSYTLVSFALGLLKKALGIEGVEEGQPCETIGVCSLGCLRCIDNLWQFDGTCPGCQEVNPSGPGLFYIRATTPSDSDIVARNTIIQIVFNRQVSSDSVNQENFVLKKVVEENEQEVSVTLEQSSDKKTIFIKPTQLCPEPYQTEVCLDEESTYHVKIQDVISETSQNLNCNNGKCDFSFKTNNQVEEGGGESITERNTEQGVDEGTESGGEELSEGSEDTTEEGSTGGEGESETNESSEQNRTNEEQEGTTNEQVEESEQGSTTEGGAEQGTEQGSEAEEEANNEDNQNNQESTSETGKQGDSLCGNGLIDEGEQCDGDNLGSFDCSSLGYQGGILSCNSDCSFNTTDCWTEESSYLGQTCQEDTDCFPPGTPEQEMIGLACYNGTCVYFPAPSNVAVVSATLTEIKVKWNHFDPYNLATSFEIYRRTSSDTDYNLIATCYLDDFTCSPSDNFKFEKQGDDYIFYEYGEFNKDELYYYKIRAKRGTHTVYSAYSEEAQGEIKGVMSCRKNQDCPSETPCCNLETHQCVSWPYCQGFCTRDEVCQPESSSAFFSFNVKEGAPLGLCLYSVSPNQGEINEKVVLQGDLFGSSQGKVVFQDSQENIEESSVVDSWQDKEIKSNVAFGLKSGWGLVWVEKPDSTKSNVLPFKVITELGGAGENCKLESASACSFGADICQSPFECLADSSNEDCRCCCNPSLEGVCGDLSCLPNVSPCQGETRGMCCGCENDSQCQDINPDTGCGFLDKNRCCWPKPIIKDIDYCQVGGRIGLNADIKIEFSTLMDLDSLNLNNIKFYYQGECVPGESGIYQDNKCYLQGRISKANEGDYTLITFSPDGCDLKANGKTLYLEIIGGENGEGVRSSKGVSMSSLNQAIGVLGSEGWYCGSAEIKVKPTEMFIDGINQTKEVKAWLVDEEGDPVCWKGEFTWIEGDKEIIEFKPDESGQGGTITSLDYGKTDLSVSCGSTEKSIPIEIKSVGPKVIEHNSCFDCSETGQSPSPWKNSSNACLNAQIYVKFSQPVSIENRTEALSVYPCDGDSFYNLKCDSEAISGVYETGENWIRFKPENLLSANTFYQVILKSKNIKNEQGEYLDGNKNGKYDGQSDDYIWRFKTSEDNCQVGKVCLYPHEKIIDHPGGSQDFSGVAYADNCNWLEPTDYEWTWSLESVSPWTSEDVAQITGTNQNQVTVKSQGLGEVKVKGQVQIFKEEEQGQILEDKAHLIVRTEPQILSVQPKDEQENICPNTLIKVWFDQLMDKDSFDDNIELVDQENNQWPITFSTETIENKTLLKIKPKRILSVSETFTVKIKTGVKSIYGRALSKDYEWSFTTTPNICKLNKVEISVASVSDSENIDILEGGDVIFYKPSLYVDYQAKAFSSDGQEIFPIEGVYDWDWKWEVEDSTVAILGNDEDENPATQRIVSQNKESRTNISVKAEVVSSGQEGVFEDKAQVEVFVCEIPWVYEDTDVNFRFKYCRGNSEGALIFDSQNWILTSQRESWIGLSEEESYTGRDSLLIHQDPGQPYPGKCSEGVCQASGDITKDWPESFPFGKYCNWSGKYCDFTNNPSCGECKVAEDSNLPWPWTNRVMWAKATYDTVPFNLVPGQKYTFSFYGKGKLASNLRVVLCYNLGWCAQCSSYLYCQRAGYCEKGETCEYADLSLSERLNYKDDSCCRCRYRQWPYQNKCYPAISLGSVPAGNYPQWTWFGFEFDYSQDLANTFDRYGNLRNEVGISIGYNNTGSGTDFYLDSIMFRLGSKKEAESLESRILPELHPKVLSLSSDSASDLVKEIIFTNSQNNDIIGVRVYRNQKLLDVEDWYKNNVPNPGDYNVLEIDGYKAIQSGRTVYLGAPNITSSGRIEPLIYLISYNDNASSSTKQIYSQLVENWQFNINVE